MQRAHILSTILVARNHVKVKPLYRKYIGPCMWIAIYLGGPDMLGIGLEFTMRISNMRHTRVCVCVAIEYTKDRQLGVNQTCNRLIATVGSA